MKVLLVEDDKFFQKFYVTRLEEQEFTVEAASNGDEGLAKISEFKPDIIILDLIMPKKNGFEFLEEYSQLNYKAPVLVFSTLGQEEDVQKAMSLGATDYVNKGLYDFESLKKKIMSLK